MECILNQLKQVKDWKTLFQEYTVFNHLPKLQIQKLSLENVQIFTKHLKKLVQKQQYKIKTSWVSTQYQILKLFANSISVISSKIIQNFDQEDWRLIQQIFYYKQLQTIKYELIRIVMDKKQQRRRWSAQQENFLIEIVKKSTKKNKWNQVARQLFIVSNAEFYRQGKHCRERWLNHLHPSIQNQLWSQQEDLKLLRLILKKGKKWAKVAKKFGMKRSQCMVKKRFFQLLNKNQSLLISNQMLKQLIKKTIQNKLIKFQESIVARNQACQNPSIKIQQRGEDSMFIQKNSNYKTGMSYQSSRQNKFKKNTYQANEPIQQEKTTQLCVKHADLQQKRSQYCIYNRIQQKNQNFQNNWFNNYQFCQTVNNCLINNNSKFTVPSNQKQENLGFKPYQPFKFFTEFQELQNNFIMTNFFVPYADNMNNMQFPQKNSEFFKNYKYQS